MRLLRIWEVAPEPLPLETWDTCYPELLPAVTTTEEYPFLEVPLDWAEA